jgi:hypothetical protein
MKIVKLHPIDARVWRENRPVLLDGEGNFVRHMTTNEAHALFAVEKEARHLRQPCSAEIKSDEDDRMVPITTKPNSISRETMILESTVDGHSVVDGRVFFKTQVLVRHGECQLRSQTGQFMCTVRDPAIERPTVGDAARTSPKPAHCQCKGWGQPEGRHHKICEWNAKAPFDEQALDSEGNAYPAQLPNVVVKVEKPSVLGDNVPQMMARSMPISMTGPVVAPPAHNASAKALPISSTVVSHMPAVPTVVATPAPAPSPATCVCKDFPAADGFVPKENHHPVCQWKEAWDSQNAGSNILFLVNLETGELGRQASVGEVETARSEQGFVLIGETQYGVLTKEEATKKKPAAPAVSAAAPAVSAAAPAQPAAPAAAEEGAA